MSERTPLSIDIKEIENLGPDRAVEFVRRLLWAEAQSVGIGKHMIDVPQCINVGDAGIDAKIIDAHPTKEELIPLGTTGFQIKSGKSSNMTESSLKKELHEKQDLKQPIKAGIRDILENDGTYVLVLFSDITNEAKKEKENILKKELEASGYADAKVRIYTANQLQGFAEKYPSIVAWLAGTQVGGLPYSAWSGQRDIQYPKTFLADSIRDQWIDDVRQDLRKDEGTCRIMRVLGLSGVGKTRLVFEALSPDDLQSKVLYISQGDGFLTSHLANSLQVDSNLSAILVIDECSPQQHEAIAAAFEGRGNEIAIFTISHEMVLPSGESCSLKVSLLEEKSIEAILKAEIPELPSDVISRLSKFADGYPRIAMRLAESYQSSGQSSTEFITLDDENLFNRLIGGKIDPPDDHFRKTRRVLTALSLFEKIGYKGSLSEEAKWLTNTFGIAWQDFVEIVGEQKRRGIIQGEHYLYVTPFMLRVYLLQQWWDDQGFTEEEFLKFIEEIPDSFRHDLLKRMTTQIPFVTTTEKGRDFTRKILGDAGFITEDLLDTEIGSDFFLKLTEADPETALKFLDNTVAKWDRKRLKEFRTGRRNVVWALERIATWQDLFPNAARILLSLAEAENETWSNNASGVFVGLFSPGRGAVAPTELPLLDRLPILIEAFNSGSRERIDLALSACDQALEANHFFRMGGIESQGLRRNPNLWTPKTWGEVFDGYRKVWHLLEEQAELLTGELKQKAVNILINRSRGINGIANLTGMVIETIRQLSTKDYVDKKKLISEVVQILHYDTKRMLPDNISKWESLRTELLGSDFKSLLRRYVGMHLVEDRIDETGKHVDTAKEEIIKLARQATADPKTLEPELGWLVTAEADNGFSFGYYLGKADKTFTLLDTLIQVQEQADKDGIGYFLGGYLKAIYEKDDNEWEAALERIQKIKKLERLVPELIWRSGMTDSAATRILKLLNSGDMDYRQLRLFQYGRVVESVAPKIFNDWITYLIELDNAEAVAIALSLFDFFYSQEKYEMPKELGLKLVTHPKLFENYEAGRNDQIMDDYHWSEVAKKIIAHYPEDSLKISRSVVEHFGNKDTIADGYHTYALEVLNKILSQHPGEIWEQIKIYLGPPIDERAYKLTSWLRGGQFFDESEKEGPTALIPVDLLWKWVDEDISNRAWYLASFVPKNMFRIEGKICLAREILVRYGDREDVRDNLSANFSTEGWSGPASLHYQGRKHKLLEFKKSETIENVIRWIDEYVESLDRRIEIETIREEREGR